MEKYIKCKSYLMPAPKKKIWDKIKIKYNLPDLPDIRYLVPHYDVTLPPGWKIENNNCKSQFIILDENNNRVGFIYMTEEIGFTWIDESIVSNSTKQK